MLVAVAALALVIAVVGVTTIVGATHRTNQLAQLKLLVDKVPLPKGTKVVDETAFPERDLTPAFLERDYRLPSAESTALIRAALERENYQVLGAQANMIGEVVWKTDTSASGGDIYILPPDKSNGGIEMVWHGTDLTIRLQAGDVS